MQYIHTNTYFVFSIQFISFNIVFQYLKIKKKKKKTHASLGFSKTTDEKLRINFVWPK